MKIIRPIGIDDSGTFTRASTATYYDSAGVLKTAAINEPRWTYDPSDLTAGPRLLTEAAATNLLLRSEEFDNAAWPKNNATISANAITAPDGASTADKLVDSATTGYHGPYQGVPSMSPDTEYVVSFYAKAAELTKVYVEVQTLIPSWPSAVFDLLTGAVSGVTAISAGMESCGNGWYRCFAKINAGSGVSSNNVSINTVNASGNRYYAGDGVSGLYIWGAQLEAGTKATSYIPTTSATVTRAADSNTTMLISDIPENDYAAWSNTTMYMKGDKVLDAPNHRIMESLNGSTSTVTISQASPAIVTWTGHTLAANTPIQFTTTGTLPSPLVAGTTYYVLADTVNTVKVSATVGGAAINTTTAGSGTHTAKASTNLNKPLTDTTNWLDTGKDNRWRMFDTSITSQSSQANQIKVAIRPEARFDSIVGLNVNANYVKVVVEDPTDGIVFTKTLTLTNSAGITDLYSYMYEPIEYVADFIIEGIPAGFPDATITLTLEGSTAAIGGLVIGLSKELGITEWGSRVGVVDYSVKTKDAFGNYTITTRAFSKRGDFTFKVDTNKVDSLQSLLASYRSVPIVYLGSNSGAKQQFNSTLIYGYYKDFQVDIAYSSVSTCSMQIEGLT